MGQAKSQRLTFKKNYKETNTSLMVEKRSFLFEKNNVSNACMVTSYPDYNNGPGYCNKRNHPLTPIYSFTYSQK